MNISFLVPVIILFYMKPANGYYINNGFNLQRERNFCETFEISSIDSENKSERKEIMDHYLFLTKSQNSFCPAGYKFANSFDKMTDYKIKDKFFSEIAKDSLLHLEAISDQDWSQAYFKKINLQRKII